MPVQSLSPAIVRTLIESVANGSLKPAAIISNVQAGVIYAFGNKAARFQKNAPGDFEVSIFEGDKADVVDTIKASTAVEAKLTVVDILADEAKKH